MARLTTCPNCDNHILVSESACPHCATTQRLVSSPVVPMVLLGLALVGCPADDSGDSETSMTSSDGDSETTGTGDSTMDETTTDSGEAEYGVPDTGFETDSTEEETTDAGEAEYGVPDTGFETDSTDETTTDAGEAEYGVPDTGSDG